METLKIIPFDELAQVCPTAHASITEIHGASGEELDYVLESYDFVRFVGGSLFMVPNSQYGVSINQDEDFMWNEQLGEWVSVGELENVYERSRR